jgi:hypothetical protein
MHSHTCRLHQHRLLQANLLIDLVHKILAGPEELAQRPLRIRWPGGCSKPHLATQVVRSVFTGRTEATRGARLDGHAVTDGDAGHAGPDAVNCARCFVAHYYACAGVDAFADAAMVPEVDLCVSACCPFAYESKGGLGFYTYGGCAPVLE